MPLGIMDYLREPQSKLPIHGAVQGGQVIGQQRNNSYIHPLIAQ